MCAAKNFYLKIIKLNSKYSINLKMLLSFILKIMSQNLNLISRLFPYFAQFIGILYKIP